MDPNGEANRTERGDTRDAPPANNTDSRSSLSWRRWIRPVVYVFYGLLVAAATPFVIIDFTKAGEDDKFKRTLAFAGFFGMVIAIPISLWGIVNHMIYFTRPRLQKHLIRILMMVPIYVLTSWFALRFPDAKIYFNTIRELYKAFTVFHFVFYLVAFFDEVPDFESRMAMKSEIKMIRRCKFGVLNYTVIQILVTVVTIVTNLTGSYNEGDFSADNSYFWLISILSVSQIWAMTSKNVLRSATLDELKLLPRSTLQFVGVQLVIYFTDFQGSFLNTLARRGVMKPNPAWGFEDELAFSTMLQDFLICFEMMGYAALFTYSFDYKRYDTDEPKLSIAQIFKHLWTLSELKSSVKEYLRTRGNRPTSPVGGYQSNGLVLSEQLPAVDEVHPSESPTV